MTYKTMKSEFKTVEHREIDTLIDKVMVIWTSFMQDIETTRLNFVYDRCNSFLFDSAPNNY